MGASLVSTGRTGHGGGTFMRLMPFGFGCKYLFLHMTVELVMSKSILVAVAVFTFTHDRENIIRLQGCLCHFHSVVIIIHGGAAWHHRLLH